MKSTGRAIQQCGQSYPGGKVKVKAQFTSRVKDLLRPIARHRFVLERMKYRGDTILDWQAGNDRLSQILRHGRAGAAGKIGSVEMGLCHRYLHDRDQPSDRDFGRYAKLARIPAGIYPTDPKTLSRFCDEFLRVLKNIDLLGVWFNFGEAAVRRQYAPGAALCKIRGLEPYYHERPWSAQLADKKVVVISPFEETIHKQYSRRKLVWAAKPDVMPDFDLQVIRCPQISGLLDTPPEYPDWFAGLQALKLKLDAAVPFDVAIVGAGAWSIPLAAHAKSLGAFGIHLGGATQLLFGIMGGRWESNAAINALRNDAWTRPSQSERPKNFRLAENGSYW